MSPSLNISTAATLACLWEATASKPGNVNRFADFSDLGLVDFLNSAALVGQSINQWQNRPQIQSAGAQATNPMDADLWQLVLSMVQTTGLGTATNSNLGICLLLAPLALACTTPPLSGQSVGQFSKRMLRDQVNWVLKSATVRDTDLIYEAIRIAKPGGMGQTETSDVHSRQPLQSNETPAYVMGLAADRDSIAAEYTNDFETTFAVTLPMLKRLTRAGYSLQWTIVGTFVELLATKPDSLIQRKLGPEAAVKVSEVADVVRGKWFADRVPDWNQFQTMVDGITDALADLDFYLRADGHRRNPGTTADLIAAGLFVSLLTGDIAANQKW